MTDPFAHLRERASLVFLFLGAPISYLIFVSFANEVGPLPAYY